MVNSIELSRFLLDNTNGTSLHLQLTHQLRDAILSGEVAGGVRLPSSRHAASQLGCSRNTVLAAYDTLIAEGLLYSKVGSGCFVTEHAPWLPTSPVELSETVPEQLTLSARGMRFKGVHGVQELAGAAFAAGMPDLKLFPFAIWARILGRVWRHPSREMLMNRDPAGWFPLRVAIADYLSSVRGLMCKPEEVIVTSGAQQSIDLVSRLLLEAKDTVLLEDPGYTGIRAPLEAAELRVLPVPLDEEGIDVSHFPPPGKGARMAVVTPSHQYPMGTRMSLGRRLALLDWAYENEGWILEDDYDSEYQYAGRQLATLRNLDQQRQRHGRVLYLGSFSKVMFPGLRLGYLIVPASIREAFVSARQSLDEQTSMIVQGAMEKFISDGFLTSHIRRSRQVYGERQDYLLEELQQYPNNLLEVKPNAAGLHLVAKFQQALCDVTDDVAVAALCAQAGLTVRPLSGFYRIAPPTQGLVLGYGSVPPDEIKTGVKQLMTILEKLLSTSPTGP